MPHKKGLVFIIILLSIGVSAIKGETIRIANGEWPPYQSKDLKDYGFVSRITTEAFASEGIKVEYKFYPWKRSYKAVKNGKMDGAIFWVWSEDRENSFYFSDQLTEVNYVFWHLKNTPFQWSTYKDLKDVIIGGTIGYNYGRKFENAENAGQIEVHRVSKDQQNLKKLLAGRITVFPLDMIAGYHMIRKHFPPEKLELITYHPKSIIVNPGYLILSKKISRNKRMLRLFNRGLRRLKANGKFYQYLEDS